MDDINPVDADFASYSQDQQQQSSNPVDQEYNSMNGPGPKVPASSTPATTTDNSSRLGLPPFDQLHVEGPIENTINNTLRKTIGGALGVTKGAGDFLNVGMKQLQKHPLLSSSLVALNPLLGEADVFSKTGGPQIWDQFSQNIGENIQHMNDQVAATNPGTGKKILYKAAELGGAGAVVPSIFDAAKIGAAPIVENSVAQKALGKVATIASGVGKTPVQKAVINAMVRSAPENILAGIGTSGIIDPQSLTTAKGVAVSAGMGAVGSLFEGLNAGILAKQGATFPEASTSDVDALQNAGTNGVKISKTTVNWWNGLDINQKILAQKVGSLENVPMSDLNTNEGYINKLYSDPDVRKALTDLLVARQTAETQQQLNALGPEKTPAQIRDENFSKLRPKASDMEIPINNPVSAIDELTPETSDELLGYKKDVGQQAKAQYASNPNNASNIGQPSTYNPNPNAPTPSGPNNTSGRGGGFGGKPPSGLVGQPNPNPTPPNPNNGLPSYSNNIQSRIYTTNQTLGQTVQSLMGSIINGIKNIPKAPDWFRQEFVNRTHNLTVIEKDVGIDGLPARDLPSAQAQLANGSAWGADEFIKGRGGYTLDPNTGTPVFTGTPAYQNILRGFSNDQIDAFRRARLAAHVLDERISSQYVPGTTLPRVPGPAQFGAANIDVGIDPNDARMELANAPADVVHAVATATQLLNEASNYAVTEGRLDAATLDAWRRVAPSYTSLQRAFESPEPEPTSTLGRVNQTVNRFYKELRGNSTLQINDPIQNDIDYIRTSKAAADRNRVWMMLREAAVADPAKFTGIMEPAPAATQLTNQRLFAIANQIAQQHNLPQNVALQIAIQFNPDVFDAQSNTKMLYNNGVAETWKISPELAKVANAMTPLETNLWMDLLRAPAAGLKLGITKNPIFPVFHFFRDYFQAKVNSQYGNTLGVNTIAGLVEAIKKGDMYHEFQASGAGGGTLNSAGNLDSFTSAASLRSVIPKTPLEAITSTVMHPVEALSKLYEPLYIAGKLGEYMKARASGADGATAALAARNVTPDMANIGGSMKALSSMDAFLNPAIQHIDQFYQNAKANPFGVVANGFKAITLPTIALYLLNHDDQAIQELRRGANGSRYWYIRVSKASPTNSGILRLPKPWIPGYLFGTLAEQALDAMMTEHPDILNQMKDAFKTEANFSFVPQAAQIPMSLYANKDYYSGIPIVPLGLEQVDPQYQTTAQTTNLAKRASDILFRSSGGHLNISPAQIDYIIRTATGNMGADIANATGTEYKGVSGPAPTMADRPIIGKLFARYPTSGAEDVRKFYDFYDKASTYTKTMADLGNHNPTRLNEYLQRPDVQKWMQVAGAYTETYKQISELNKTIHDIDNLPDNAVPAGYKREVTDHIMTQIIQMTKTINNSTYQFTSK